MTTPPHARADMSEAEIEDLFRPRTSGELVASTRAVVQHREEEGLLDEFRALSAFGRELAQAAYAAGGVDAVEAALASIGEGSLTLDASLVRDRLRSRGPRVEFVNRRPAISGFDSEDRRAARIVMEARRTAAVREDSPSAKALTTTLLPPGSRWLVHLDGLIVDHHLDAQLAERHEAAAVLQRLRRELVGEELNIDEARAAIRRRGEGLGR